jgi:hypothetical protein
MDHSVMSTYLSNGQRIEFNPSNLKSPEFVLKDFARAAREELLWL